MKNYIFTGAPGSGKTSVIAELEKLGHAVIHEAATEVIEKQQLAGINRPWEELNFIDNIINMQKDRQMKATEALQFYDRSPFCTYALGKYLSHWKNLEFIPSFILLNEIDRSLKDEIYQNQVFFFENLGFIKNNEARTISLEEALVFEQIHLEVYNNFGFEVIFVPKNSIDERCNFILNVVS